MSAQKVPKIPQKVSKNVPKKCPKKKCPSQPGTAKKVSQSARYRVISAVLLPSLLHRLVTRFLVGSATIPL